MFYFIFAPPCILTQVTVTYYLRRHLANGEGIVSLGVCLSRCVCVHGRRINLGGEGIQCSLVCIVSWCNIFAYILIDCLMVCY